MLRALARVPKPDDDDIPAIREARTMRHLSRLGRVAYGAPDPRVEVAELMIPTQSAPVRALVHRPKRTASPPRLVVNFHGGGWTIGVPETSAWFASRLASRLDAVVVSPTYRQAPEAPYPAAVHDTWDALRWIDANRDRFGAGAGSLAVMGDSAGGNLAAVCTLRARDLGTPDIAAQVLVFPAVELDYAFASERIHADGPLLTAAGYRRFVERYLADGAEATDPEVSPLRADLAGLPPALIVTAAHDPIADQGGAYADALAAAGVPVEQLIYDRAIHGFIGMPGVVPQARAALRDTVAFLDAHLP